MAIQIEIPACRIKKIEILRSIVVIYICGTGGVFMKNIDIHGMTNMELIRGGIAEWYWATDYIHGDLYEAEELFRQGHLVRSNRLYLIHYPDGMIYEPVHSADGQYLGTPVYDGSSVVLLVVSFTESYPHHEVLASTSGSTGSSAATVICSEGLLQSDASYITVIADSTAK